MYSQYIQQFVIARNDAVETNIKKNCIIRHTAKGSPLYYQSFCIKARTHARTRSHTRTHAHAGIIANARTTLPPPLGGCCFQDESSLKKKKINKLFIMEIVCFALGFVIGFVVRKFNPTEETIIMISFPGEIYGRALNMTPPLLVISTIISGTRHHAFNDYVSAHQLVTGSHTGCLSDWKYALDVNLCRSLLPVVSVMHLCITCGRSYAGPCERAVL